MKRILVLVFIVWTTLASNAANQVVAWGSSQYGVLNVPANLTNAVAIAAGNYHSMALRSDGTVTVWGNRYYSLTNVPSGLSNVVAISAYGDQCLALKADGKVVGWGTPATLVPIVNALSNVVGLAARNDASLALTAEGFVKMWNSSSLFMYVPPAAQSNVVAIAGGDNQTLVLKEDGQVVGWGNWGTGSGSVTMKVPNNLNDVISLGAGQCQCVGLKTDGTLYSWGVNHYGGETNAPVGLTNVAAIAIAHNHGLALRENGSVVGWGYNLFDSETYVPPGLTNVIMIAAGAGHNLALVNDGSPAITLQPRPQKVYEGTSATFVAMAVGASPLAYQWRCNGTNVPDGTARILVLADRQTGTLENYSVAVSNSFGSAVSQPAALTVMPGQIIITHQPSNRTDNAGLTATFTVSATGRAPLQYQWRKFGINLNDGARVTNSQTATLTLKNVMRSDTGDYSVVITNPSGSVTSQVASLTVKDPAINSQPSSWNASAGDSIYLNVTAGGSPPLAFQWFQGETPLVDGPSVAGARTNFLTLPYVLRANEGGYRVVVTNIYGAATSQVATVTVIDPAVYSQPVSRVANVGDAVTITVDARGTPPLAYQWRKNGANISGATYPALSFPNAQPADRGVYSVAVSNEFGSLTSAQARLSVNEALRDGFSPASDGSVDSFALQTDGKLLVSGSFTSLVGQPRERLGRFNAGGSLDTQFNPGANGGIACLAVQPDGKILVVGGFGTLAGVWCTGIGRLNYTGTFDPTFFSEISGMFYSIAIAPDGTIFVGGSISSLDGLWSGCIARMNPSGSLDRSFAPYVDGYGAATCLALQPDGKILVGGNFTAISGVNRPGLARLLADGAVDQGFNPPASPSGVIDIVLQPDGRILVPGLGRLYSNGSLDSTFTPANGFNSAMALQVNGRIVLGGLNEPLSGLVGSGLGRLNSNGMVDLSFDPGIDWGLVSRVAIQGDGKILVGGSFSELAGRPCSNVGRLFNTEPATSDLAWDGTQLLWLRGGSGPEVWRTTFEYSTNLSQWVSLGPGNRITGGWRVVPAALPANCTIRARGFVASATTSWLVESRLVLSEMPPVILMQDGNCGMDTNGFGFNFTGLSGQRVVVQGSTDLLHWVSLSTNVLSGAPSRFSEPATGSYPARFYRLKSP